MDNSSRNIVKFIATITVAALLIMAARHYAMSQEVTAPPIANKVSPPPAAPLSGMAVDDLTGASKSADEEAETEVIEEDYEIKMGEPSVNIGQEATDYQELPPAAEPIVAPVGEPGS